MNHLKAKTIARVLELRELYRTGQLPYLTMKDQLRLTEFDAVCYQAVWYLEGRRDILTRTQSKLAKAQANATGYVNSGLTLSPADEAAPYLGKKFNACHGATVVCAAICVGAHQGQGKLDSSRVARIGRTIVMECFRSEFIRLLSIEIKVAELQAMKIGALLAMRLNVASDWWQMAEEVAGRFPSVKFYDYSAIAGAVRNQKNVSRVYSLKDGRLDLALKMLGEGYGVAMVFSISSKSDEPLPEYWNGIPVINGEVDDLWFLRIPTSGPFIVGLKVKGNKEEIQEAISEGFAIDPNLSFQLAHGTHGAL